MSDTVTSIALSKDGKYLLANVSLSSPRLELFDLGSPLDDRPHLRAELIRRFKGGHTQSCFVLRCAFGGANDSFVVCGSEDSTVSIWNREKGEIIAKVSGSHTQVVNAVSWCPTDPYLFATCSDDQTVRLWGTENMPFCDVSLADKDIKRVDTLR